MLSKSVETILSKSVATILSKYVETILSKSVRKNLEEKKIHSVFIAKSLRSLTGSLALSFHRKTNFFNNRPLYSQLHNCDGER